MPNWQTLEPWLRHVGKYKYHCFISWPHTKNHELADYTRRVRDAIFSKLSFSLVSPAVFLDEARLGVGDQWDPALRQALCRSVCMVAICAPVYFRSEHHWCGLEWASMYQLGLSRLPNVTHTPIIPLVLRKTEPLPWSAKGIQYIDVSRASVSGCHYFRTNEFRLTIESVVSRIEEIADGLCSHNAVANCDVFQFPTVSAFAQYNAPAQPFPIVS